MGPETNTGLSGSICLAAVKKTEATKSSHKGAHLTLHGLLLCTGTTFSINDLIFMRILNFR